MSLDYLGKHEPQKLCLFSQAVITCLENDIALACYIFDTRHLSMCRPLSPRLDEEKLSEAQSSDSNGHHQRRGERWPTTQQAFRNQERCRANSHCSARRRDRSASWLATLEWTLFCPRRRRSRQHVSGTSEFVSFSTHVIQHHWKDTISGVHVSPCRECRDISYHR